MNERDFCDPDSGFDYIFARMAAIYGGQFQRHWADADPLLVRETWKEMLGRFLTYRPSMDYALQHLDSEFPPSALAFRAICQKGPAVPRPGELAIAHDPKAGDNSEAKRRGIEALRALRQNWEGRH